MDVVIKLLVTGHTPVCGIRSYPADNITIHVVLRNLDFFIRFSSDSEGSASELLGNIEEMFIYYL